MQIEVDLIEALSPNARANSGTSNKPIKKRGFEKLILDEETKTLLKSLVTNHITETKPPEATAAGEGNLTIADGTLVGLDLAGVTRAVAATRDPQPTAADGMTEPVTAVTAALGGGATSFTEDGGRRMYARVKLAPGKQAPFSTLTYRLRDAKLVQGLQPGVQVLTQLHLAFLNYFL